MKTLSANAMNHMAEYVRKTFHVEVTPDITFEDVIRPGFWHHHIRKLSKHDIVEVLGNGWEARLRVLETGLGYARMRVLSKWADEAVTTADATAENVVVPEGYIVDHTPRTRWRTRLADGTEVSRNHMTKQEAADSARDHGIKTGAIAA